MASEIFSTFLEKHWRKCDRSTWTGGVLMTFVFSIGLTPYNFFPYARNLGPDIVVYYWMFCSLTLSIIGSIDKPKYFSDMEEAMKCAEEDSAFHIVAFDYAKVCGINAVIFKIFYNSLLTNYTSSIIYLLWIIPVFFVLTIIKLIYIRKLENWKKRIVFSEDISVFTKTFIIVFIFISIVYVIIKYLIKIEFNDEYFQNQKTSFLFIFIGFPMLLIYSIGACIKMVFGEKRSYK